VAPLATVAHVKTGKFALLEDDDDDIELTTTTIDNNNHHTNISNPNTNPSSSINNL
jgi:hypothetical protein